MKNPIKKPYKKIKRTITRGFEKLGNETLKRENKKLRKEIAELKGDN